MTIMEMARMNQLGFGLLVYNPSNDYAIRTPDREFTNLLFMTGGACVGHRDGNTGEYIDVGAYNIITGRYMNWGEHMFFSINQFKEYVNNMHYLMNADPTFAEKVKKNAWEPFCNSSDVEGMRFCNAIIRVAEIVLNGILNGGITIPQSIIGIFENANITHAEGFCDYINRNFVHDEIADIAKRYICKALTTISNMEPFDVPTLAEIEAANKKNDENSSEEENK